MKHNEPLGLPRGSVRAIVTLLTVLPLPAVVVLAILGRTVSAEIMAFYTAILLLVLKDYFGTRTTQDAVSEKDEGSTVATGDV